MSSSHEVEEPATGNEKALASIVASTILFIGSIIQGIFRIIFRILSSLV